MDAGSLKKMVTIIAGVLIAWFFASVLSGFVVVVTGLKGAAGGFVGFVVYAVIFLGMLHILQKYAGIIFFSFFRQ